MQVNNMQSRVRSAFGSPFDRSDLPAGQAAVLIGLREPTCELILTRRAAHLNSHAGEVAFPGGKFDPEDQSLVTTVLRETQEEIGLDASAIELVGMMPSRQSRFGVNVFPFVGFVATDAVCTPNVAELDAVFEVPVQFFLDASPKLEHQVKYQQQTYLFPCFYWQDQTIWGLTAYFIVEFMAHVFEKRIVWPEPRLLR